MRAKPIRVAAGTTPGAKSVNSSRPEGTIGVLGSMVPPLLPPEPVTNHAAQSFKNGEVHHWYRLVLGFSDHLVSDLIDEFKLKTGDAVLDPFSGSGTTAVECRKRGIDCWAVDANPVARFATEVKTTWSTNRSELILQALRVVDIFAEFREQTDILKTDRTATYLVEEGMVDRGWISYRRLYDVVAIKQAILAATNAGQVRNFLLLAAMNEFVHTASNVRYGPELYCGAPRKGRVVDAFLHKILTMAQDLDAARFCPPSQVTVKHGDSRNLLRGWIKPPHGGFASVITSPPYPTEHDYTRNTRLELAFLEMVWDRDSLRTVKRRMIRSHTKGIYTTDRDTAFVRQIPRIRRLVERIEQKAKDKDYGFARLYGKVTNEYFGGMRRHFRTLHPLLKTGAHCAYVVGDQSSYFQIKIATAEILSDLACREGFKQLEIRKWRERWSSATAKFIKEHILILKA